MGSPAAGSAIKTGDDTITRYLLLVHSTATGPDLDPDAEERLSDVELLGCRAESVVFCGELHDADTATVVEVSGGDVVISHGPFSADGSWVAGVIAVEADHLDVALGLAAAVTRTVGKPVEVRPMWDG